MTLGLKQMRFFKRFKEGVKEKTQFWNTTRQLTPMQEHPKLVGGCLGVRLLIFNSQTTLNLQNFLFFLILPIFGEKLSLLKYTLNTPKHRIEFLDWCMFLGNYPPTPSQTLHSAQSEKSGLTLGLGRGSWAVSQKHTLICLKHKQDFLFLLSQGLAMEKCYSSVLSALSVWGLEKLQRLWWEKRLVGL